MNPQGPAPYPPTVFDYVVALVPRIPAAWILIGTVVLLGLAIWLTRRWVPYSRIIEGLQSAALVTSDSTASGLVKLLGQAQPGSDHAPSPYSKTPYVWCKTETVVSRSTGSFRKTGSYSVDPMLIRDSAGDCLVDPQEAVVVPTLKKSTFRNNSFDKSTSRKEVLILPGDPVVALGQISRPQPKPGREREPSCRLRKSENGVLLFSGKSERDTLLRFRLYFWSTLTAVILCLELTAFGFWAHLQGYPNQSVGEYVEALTKRPLMTYPGEVR